jgi:hypothetical protein
MTATDVTATYVVVATAVTATKVTATDVAGRRSATGRVKVMGARAREGFRRLTPLRVGLLGGAIALGFVGLRLVMAADGDVSRFVVAGDFFADPASVDPEIHVVEGSTGSDGQFFWRLAVDPTEWELEPAHGVGLDSAYRPPRIGYPLLAWLGAGGQPSLVAWSLVGINVAAVGAISGLGAMVAERARRLPVWGLLLASAPGFVVVLARDLAEIVTWAALLGGIVALQRRRPAIAAAAWSLAVLTREQALVVIGAYGLWRLVALVRRQARFGGDDLPWLVPPVVLAIWQCLLWAALGELPLTEAGGSNLALPFTDLVPAIGRWAQGDLGRLEILVPVQLLLGVVLVVAALRWAARALAEPDRWLVLALGLVTLSAVSLAKPVWDGPADLRHASDVFSLSWLVLLLGAEQPPRWLVAATIVVWLATAGLRVVAI